MCVRVYGWSDLHTDRSKNLAVVEAFVAAAVSTGKHRDDILLVAGDISHDHGTLMHTLIDLKRAFGDVAFVPGNHDLWVLTQEETSLDRFDQIMRFCRSEGIHTAPFRAGQVLVVPIHSWYDEADPEFVPSRGDFASWREGLRFWQDYRRCRWPLPLEFRGGWLDLEGPDFVDGDDARCRSEDGTPLPIHGYFLRMSESLKPQDMRAGTTSVVTFSHFVPRGDLCRKGMLKAPFVSLAMGSGAIDAEARRWGADVHLFGHSHFDVDEVREGVRYVQWPMGYGSEFWLQKAGAPRLLHECP